MRSGFAIFDAIMGAIVDGVKWVWGKFTAYTDYLDRLETEAYRDRTRGRKWKSVAKKLWWWAAAIPILVLLYLFVSLRPD